MEHWLEITHFYIFMADFPFFVLPQGWNRSIIAVEFLEVFQRLVNDARRTAKKNRHPACAEDVI